jgi:GntR family transcriptional regulator
MTASEPVYLRVLEDLRTRIRTGSLEPGARVPSRNAIIANYGVGETAAKHALQVLSTEGLIEARPGSGSYVRKVPAALLLEHDRLHFPGSPFGIEESVAVGSGPDAAVRTVARRLAWEHQTEQLVPPQPVARRLGLQHGAVATVTRYLLRCDGDPVQLAMSYEPAGLTAGTAIAIPEQGPLAGRGVIARMRSVGIEIDQVVEDVSVRASLRAEAETLMLPAGALVLSVGRAHLAAGKAVEVGEIVIPADRFKLRYRFPASDGTA